MRMKKNLIVFVFLIFVVSIQAQQNIQLQFHHKVGDKNLQLFTETYSNAFNESFTVNRFKYYISSITIMDDKGKQFIVKHKYFLIDEADSNSKKISINTSLKNIAAIEFTIGVDSLHNVSGVQTGTLDPMHGMFWTWKSGYVFAKLEGQSDSSHAQGKYFGYHIGGFRTNENALRKIRLSIINYQLSIVNIKVDILKWFNAVYPIKINQTAFCHQPGALALQLADNYSNMFSIQP